MTCVLPARHIPYQYSNARTRLPLPAVWSARHQLPPTFFDNGGYLFLNLRQGQGYGDGQRGHSASRAHCIPGGSPYQARPRHQRWYSRYISPVLAVSHTYADRNRSMTCAGGFRARGGEIGDVYISTAVANHDRHIPIPVRFCCAQGLESRPEVVSEFQGWQA